MKNGNVFKFLFRIWQPEVLLRNMHVFLEINVFAHFICKSRYFNIYVQSKVSMKQVESNYKIASHIKQFFVSTYMSSYCIYIIMSTYTS